jgi:dethiobiotin synthetase/malonyl-CoA O-methyltransferase
LKGVFVTGTDTGIGKTMVSAWLVRSWGADYWKPVQSGIADGADADVIGRAAPDATIHASAYTLTEPLSPHEAARRDGVTIDLGDFHLPRTDRPLVVEGAGGLLVPLNDRFLMADLMSRLGLPVVLVARSGLGTINHTLLTVEALRSRAIPLAGVVLSGPLNPANRRAIEQFGAVSVVGELPLVKGIEGLRQHPPLAWCPWSSGE